MSSNDNVSQAVQDEGVVKKRKLRNLLIKPQGQLRTAMAVFAAGFVFLSVLFAILLFRLNNLIQDLANNIAVPEQAVSDTAWTLLVTYAVLLFSFLLCSVVIVLFATHRYLGPMVPIERLVKALREGRYDERVRLRKNDEFQDLADELNLLAETLATRHRNQS